MKHNKMLVSGFTCLLLLGARGVSAQESENKFNKGYAFNCSSVVTDVRGIYSFDFGTEMSNVENVVKLEESTRVGSPVLYNGSYYFLDWTSDTRLRSLSLDGEKLTDIKTYGDYNACNHFTYNHQDGKVYCVENGYDDAYESVTYLETVDLTNGNIDTLCVLQPDNGTSLYAMGLAVNYDGEMYVLNEDGQLFSVDYPSGRSSYVGTMDYNPDDVFYQENNSLFFDDNSGKLYYRMKTYGGGNELVSIDTKTAATTRVCNLSGDKIFCGFSISYQAAAAGAPARVSDLVITPAAEGRLSATLSWTNPSMTYGGESLDAISSVLIYRNGTQVGEVTGATVGGRSTWTDESVPSSSKYTYTVVAVNASGNGDRSVSKMWIGNGIPLSVTDVTLSTDGARGQLAWKAPAVGQDDAYVNPDMLRYDVIRYPDEKLVASDLSATEFTDETIDALGRYYYTVTVKNDAGTAEAVSSNSLVMGPALDVPCNMELLTSDELDTWTIIDADGNGHSWRWTKGYGSDLTGARVTYWNDKVAADDWLISPPVNFEAGYVYQLKFAVQSGTDTTDSLEVTFGTGATAELQKYVEGFVIDGNEVDSITVILPKVEKDCVGYFGFHCVTPLLKYYLAVAGVTVTKTIDTNVDLMGQVANVLINGRHITVGAAEDRVTLFDVRGCCVTGVMTGSTAYELNNIPAGLYIVRVETEGGVVCKKIIIK